MNGLHDIYSGNDAGLLVDRMTGLANGLFNDELSKTKVVKAGLKMYLDASVPSSINGIYWGDISGNGNYGRFVNGPTWHDSYRYVGGGALNNLDQAGYGGMVRTDGVNDYILVRDSISLRNFRGLTLSTWSRGYSDNPRWFGKWTGGNNYILRNSAQFFLTTSTLAGGTFAGLLSNARSYNWHNIVATWDGATMRMYMDAKVSVTTYAQTGFISNAGSNLIIGAEHDLSSPTQMLFGSLMIYDRALSQQEINTNYIAQKTRFGIIYNQ